MKVSSIGDIQRLFSALNMDKIEVEKAKRNADSNDVDLMGRAVLVFWKKTRGRDATRQAIFKAMDAYHDSQAKGKLIQRWQQKYGST